jgi:hypothetical protein
MRLRALVRQLREVEEVRAVQHRAAELDALRLADLVEARGRELSERQEHVSLAEAGWRDALDAGALGTPTANAWSAAIRLGVDASVQAQQRLEASRLASTQGESRRQQAASHHRLAGGLVKAAARRLAAHFEDHRDAELIDLHAARRGRA